MHFIDYGIFLYEVKKSPHVRAFLIQTGNYFLASANTASRATSPTNPPAAKSPIILVIDPITSTPGIFKPATSATIAKPINDISKPVKPPMKSPKFLNALFITKIF